MEDLTPQPTYRETQGLRTNRTVSKERVAFLWKRVRNMARILGRISKMSKDIQLLGSTNKTYIQQTKKETFTNSNSGLKAASNNFLLLNPKSTFLKYWSLLMLVLLLYTLTITPYLVCFIDTLSTSMDYFTLTIDLLFCCDIIVNLNLAYVDDDENLITDRLQIVKKYLKGWFWIDLISSIPFQFIEQQYMKANYNKLFRLLRLPRLYKLFKVLRLKRIVSVFKRYTFVKKIMFLLREHTGILNLLKFSFTVTILVHILGCLWYFTAKYNDLGPETWVFRHGYINSDVYTLYITSIYFIFTTLTTVGYGDIYPFTMEERVFVLMIMSFGVAFYSYTISNLSTIMASIDTRTSNLKARISALNEFAKATKLPEELKQRIKSHILVNYEENIFSWFDQDSLMNELPSSLRTEVSLYMHHKIVEKIYFFQDKDPGFISYMVPKLRTICLQPGNDLYKEHEYPDEVYFLTRGRVNLIASNGLPFKTYVQGSYFGESEILDNKTRICKVQAQQDGADFLVLSKRHFLKLMEEFPKIAEEIRETARIRNLKNLEAKEAVLKIDVNNSPSVPQNLMLKLENKSKTMNPKLSSGSGSTLLVSSGNVERTKQKSVSSTKEKNRKLWQSIREKHEKEKISPRKEEKNNKADGGKHSMWDSMMKNLFRRKPKKNSIAPNEHNNKEMALTSKYESTINSAGFSTSSKWNIVRNRFGDVLKMSKGSSENSNVFNQEINNEKLEQVDWLLDDADINSPLGSDDRNKSDPKLLLLKALNSNLAQHNLRMQFKINIAKKAFATLKGRQAFIKSQIETFLQTVEKNIECQ